MDPTMASTIKEPTQLGRVSGVSDTTKHDDNPTTRTIRIDLWVKYKWSLTLCDTLLDKPLIAIETT